MIDWTASMRQTFEFYTVDPVSWRDLTKLNNVKACSISRDANLETLCSATFDITETVGECYIRVYLVASQNGVTEKYPLGTFLAQTPSSVFDGKLRSVSVDAYSPLLELKEKQPPLGYYLKKGKDVMEHAYILTKDNTRTPVIAPFTPSTALTYDFVANESDTWLTFIRDLLSAAYVSTRYAVDVGVDDSGETVYTRLNNVIESSSLLEGVETAIDDAVTTASDRVYRSLTTDGEEVLFCTIFNTNNYKFDLDELGRITFAPEQDTASLSPVWTYTDDNSSILHPTITVNHDMYGIPNVVEVLYSDGNVTYYGYAKNDDPNSPTSTVRRGREIIQRVTNPTLYGTPTQERVDGLAKQLLRELSTVEYTLTYVHGYCPVRVGDCVRLNYSRAGLSNIKAKVVSQSIECTTGCSVTEVATFTNKLWG